MGTPGPSCENAGASIVGACAAVAGEGPLFDAVVAALEHDGIEAARSFETTDARVTVYLTADLPRLALARDELDTFAAATGESLKSAFRFLRNATAALRVGAGGGSIVFVAPRGHASAHDAVRQGLRLLVKSAALELGPEHIRVNIVLPGAEDSPLGHSATPENIADAVAFLASKRAVFMTGADVIVDGGLAAQ